MDIKEKIYQKSGRKDIFLGNEAIVRGALEAGVQFVATYPGTPASEIGDIFSALSRSEKNDFYFEYSINEKVAMEAGIGASFSNLKTLIVMKHFGLNVASDALLPFVYTGSKGPTVIVVADDPSCHSSGQSEENTRNFAYLAHIPILEPSDSQEAKDFVKLGFEISEKFNIPIMIRTTTRVSHQSGVVQLGKIKKSNRTPVFVKNYRQFVTMPPRVLEMHGELLQKIKAIRTFSEKSEINKTFQVSGFRFQDKIGIITSGVSYLYVMDALNYLNLKMPVLKLGFFYPLSEQKIKNFIKPLDKVLIVEELDPYVEKEITALAKDVNPGLKIHGKNLLPEVGELKPEQVMAAIAKLTGRKYDLPKIEPYKGPKRLPSLCPGCPYWSVFNGVKQAVKESGLKPDEVIFGGDIGCYMLASFAPHNLQDYLLCMGSSVGIAHGIAKAINRETEKLKNEKTKKQKNQKVIAFIGDSTFFHAGIPALINVVHNQSNPLVIVMDNQTTAMTGQQPHPGVRETGRKQKGQRVKIEEVIKACGIEDLEIIDPIKNYKEFVFAVKNFLKKDRPAVIVARSACIRLKR